MFSKHIISITSTIDNIGGCKYHFFELVCGKSALLKIKQHMDQTLFKTIFGQDGGKNINTFAIDHNCEDDIYDMVSGR